MEIFKNTDTEFRKIKIRDICQVKTGKRDANEQSVDGIYPFFTCGKQNSKADFFDFDCEAILIAGNGNSLGFTQYYEGKFTAYQRTYVLKDFGKYNPKYLFYYIKFFFLNRIKRNIQGAAVNYIRIDDILDFEIDYPICNSDVEKIANFLSERESYLQSIQALISKMEQRNQYYFDNLVSGKGYVDSNNEFYLDKETERKTVSLSQGEVSIPKHWSVEKVGDFLSWTTGLTPPKNNPDNYVGDCRWINISDMGNRLVENKKTINPEAKNVKKKMLEKGSLLFSFKLTVGLVGFTKYENMVTNEAIIALEPSKNNNLNYLYYALPYFLKKNCQTNAYGAPLMNQSLISDSLVALPPKDERQRNSDFLDSLDNELELVKQLYSKEKQVFQWLCEKLVSGEYKIEK